MLRFIKFFQGYLFVCVSGYSPERFLNLCTKMNIVLWNVKTVEEGYTFCISRKAFALIDPALQKTGTQIQVIRRTGIPFLIHKYRRHCFFLIGIGCACFLLILMSEFIWRVDISGNVFYSDQMISDFLEKNGAGYASWKKSIDCKELQTALRANFDDITWVSAKIEGTRLYIEIQERIKGNDSKDADNDQAETPADLIASVDGIVESITTRQGTPMVIAQDEVKQNDVLVSGIVERNNDAGEVADRKYVRSDADVVVRTVLPYEDSFSRFYEKKVPTGKQKTDYLFHINETFLDLKKPVKDKTYIQTDEICPVVIGSDFYLPFQIVKKNWREIEILPGEYSKEEIKKLAEEHYLKYCEKLMENGVQIIQKSVIIDNSGEIIHVAGELEVLVRQTTFREFSADIPADDTEEGTLTGWN